MQRNTPYHTIPYLGMPYHAMPCRDHAETKTETKTETHAHSAIRPFTHPSMHCTTLTNAGVHFGEPFAVRSAWPRPSHGSVLVIYIYIYIHTYTYIVGRENVPIVVYRFLGASVSSFLYSVLPGENDETTFSSFDKATRKRFPHLRKHIDNDRCFISS